MNKAAIKNFAIWARNKLIADISYRAGLMGITEKGIKEPLPQSNREMQFFDIGTAEPYAISGSAIRQREKLVAAIEQKAKSAKYEIAYKNVMEEVAYTWFNRLIAIRFMEINDYMPAHVRVLSSDSGKMEPDIVTTPFDAELDFTEAERQTIIALKTGNQLDELFRLLFIKQCNALNAYLPALFEKTEDYTELLLNLSVIDQDGVVYHLVHDIDEAGFDIRQGGQVEIIGWLYQYYNTEPKAEAFAQKEKIRKDQIPAVTQLFTPDWIVRYMVENSLGRLWVEGHPANENLKSNWKYYLEEAEQEPEVQAQLAEIRKEYAQISPEDIRVIDPCMGSGHILVYCFDVLMQIYEAAGYSQRDAAKMILEHNIYGLDIDDRAFQLAYFALMMKARQYNRRILSAGTVCHVHSICESNEVNRGHLKYFGADLSSGEKEKALNQMQGLIEVLHDAKEYGSILNVEDYDWSLLRRFVENEGSEAQLNIETVGIEKTQELLEDMIEVGEALAQKYHVVVTNPPYMAISNGNGKLNEYVNEKFPDSKTDLYAIFIERCTSFTYKNYYTAMITQHTWMFLTSYEKLRNKIREINVSSLLHLGPHAFNEINGEVVQTACVCFLKVTNQRYLGVYVNLTKGLSEQSKENEFLLERKTFVKKQEDFDVIKGKPYTAYWASEVLLKTFAEGKCVGDISEPRVGMATASNERFVRLWFEIDINKFGINYKDRESAKSSGKKWFPFAKGGEQRKWYGNNDTVVNWENDGYEIQNFRDEKTGRVRSHNYNLDYIFQSAITWTVIGTTGTTFRLCPIGFLYSNSGYGMFCKDEKIKIYLLGFMNSKLVSKILQILSPSMGFESGYLRRVPINFGGKINKVCECVNEMIEFEKKDWDSFETSWDFQRHPLLPSREEMESLNGREAD